MKGYSISFFTVTSNLFENSQCFSSVINWIAVDSIGGSNDSARVISKRRKLKVSNILYVKVNLL